jgi:presenilin-like A22 family membrane protease
VCVYPELSSGTASLFNSVQWYCELDNYWVMKICIYICVCVILFFTTCIFLPVFLSNHRSFGILYAIVIINSKPYMYAYFFLFPVRLKAVKSYWEKNEFILMHIKAPEYAATAAVAVRMADGAFECKTLL